MKAIAYMRVSSEEQARSGLGLDGQKTRLKQEIERREWQVRWIEEKGRSARSLSREGLTEALTLLSAGEADVLLATSVDRISRSTVDFGRLLHRAKQEGWSIVALDIGLDMSTATGEMVANVVAAIAQWESRRIGERTRDALAEARRRGGRLGRPSPLPTETQVIVADLRRVGLSYQAIADRLNDAGIPTAYEGSIWHASTTRNIALRLDAHS